MTHQELDALEAAVKLARDAGCTKLPISIEIVAGALVKLRKMAGPRPPAQLAMEAAE